MEKRLPRSIAFLASTNDSHARRYPNVREIRDQARFILTERQIEVLDCLSVQKIVANERFEVDA